MKKKKPPTQNIYNLKDTLEQFNHSKNSEKITLQDLQIEINQIKTAISQIKEEIRHIKDYEEIQEEENQNFLEILSQITLQKWCIKITIMINKNFKTETVSLMDLEADLNCM